MKYLFSTVMLLVFFLSCSQQTTKTASPERSDYQFASAVTRQTALEIYLRKEPGVIVRGSGENATVSIRGVISFSDNIEPLFVINGNQVGHNYQNALAIVSEMEITSLKVLKGPDASIYGVRGAGGVVEIKAN